MGTIKVGQKSPKTIEMGVFAVVTEQPKASDAPVVGESVKEDELNGKNVERSDGETTETTETAGESAGTTAVSGQEKKKGGRTKKTQ